MSETKLPFEKIKRELLARKKSKTDLKFGKKPEERDVDELIDLGIANINKPKGGGLTCSVEPQQFLNGFLLPQKQGSSGLGLKSSTGPPGSKSSREISPETLMGYLPNVIEYTNKVYDMLRIARN